MRGLIEKLRQNQITITSVYGTPDAEPHRWISIGKTHLQQGFMALTRGIAKPETF
jgi:hypothetical protein